MREGGNGDEAEIGAAVAEALSALRGHHAHDVITAGEWDRVGRMVEIPHERCGVEEANGSDAKAAHRLVYRDRSCTPFVGLSLSPCAHRLNDIHAGPCDHLRTSSCNRNDFGLAGDGPDAGAWTAPHSASGAWPAGTGGAVPHAADGA